MESTLSQSLARLEAQFFKDPESPVLREGFQDFFDAAFALNATEANRSTAKVMAAGMRLLRRFYNAQLPKADDSHFFISLSDLCENLAFACDLLSGAKEKRIFYSGEENVYTVCCPRAVLWAALNLIANAVFYANGKYIFLHTAQSAQQVFISVSAEGHFPQKCFQTNLLRQGGGLHYAAQTARLHGGAFLLLNEVKNHSVILSLAKTHAEAPLWAESDFTDWLADRLSPVYAAFACLPTRGES